MMPHDGTESDMEQECSAKVNPEWITSAYKIFYFDTQLFLCKYALPIGTYYYYRFVLAIISIE